MSRLALKFLKMQLMMKAFYRLLRLEGSNSDPRTKGLRQHDEVLKLNVLFGHFSYLCHSKQEV